MAKPSTYKKEYCQKIIEHAKAGFDINSFGATIGVARATIYSWTQKYPDFQLAHEQAISYLRMRATQRLIDFAEGRMERNASVVAAIYLAKVYGLRDDKPLLFDGEDMKQVENENKNIIKIAYSLDDIDKKEPETTKTEEKVEEKTE